MNLFERIREGSINGVGFVTGPIELRGREDDGRHAVSIAFRAQKQLEELASAFEREARDIERDSRLSKKGQQEKLRRLGTETLVKIGNQRERLLKPVADALNALTRKRDGKPPITTIGEKTLDVLQNLIGTITATETLRLLMQLPENERADLVQTIPERGDELLYNAIMQAPDFIKKKLVPVDNAEITFEQRWLQKKDPALYSELTDIGEAQWGLSNNFEELTRAIIHRSGMRTGVPAAVVDGVIDGQQVKYNLNVDDKGQAVVSDLQTEPL